MKLIIKQLRYLGWVRSLDPLFGVSMWIPPGGGRGILYLSEEGWAHWRNGVLEAAGTSIEALRDHLESL